MKKDIIINLVMTIGISVTLFLINRYFAFYLGSTNLGLMKFFTQLLAYLNLAEMGISTASAYALYRPLSERNYKQVSIILTTISSLYNKVFLIVIIVGVFLSPIIPLFIKDKIIKSNIYLYWILYVISTALNYLFIKYSILFTADQKYGFVRLVEGGSRICCQAIQIFIIIEYKSFLGFILVLIINNLIQYIFYKLYYRKYYNYIIKVSQKEKSITKDLKNLFWHRLAGLVVFNTDLVLIAKFISLEVVGIYASYLMIVQMVMTFFNIILNVLKPKIGKFIAEHNKKEIFYYFKNLNILFLYFSIVFTFCTYKLINYFVLLWLGNYYILPQETVLLISINLFILTFRGIIDIFKEASGFFDDIYLPIFESIINFVLSIILVQYLGLNGVILGTICSNILIICIAKPIIVFERCFDKSKVQYMKIYGNYIFLVIISLLCLKFITNLINWNKDISWSYWIINSCLIFSASLIVVFIIFLSNNDFKDIIKNIFQNKKNNYNV